MHAPMCAKVTVLALALARAHSGDLKRNAEIQVDLCVGAHADWTTVEKAH